MPIRCFFQPGAVLVLQTNHFRFAKKLALVAGVPGKRIGWMSEDGQKLQSMSLAGAEGAHELLRCPGTEVRYERHGDVVVRLEENA